MCPRHAAAASAAAAASLLLFALAPTWGFDDGSRYFVWLQRLEEKQPCHDHPAAAHLVAADEVIEAVDFLLGEFWIARADAVRKAQFDRQVGQIRDC